MLVITRKLDEGITIGDDVEITVLEISKDRVKIGINAPKEVKVFRTELKTLRQTNEQSANASDEAIRQLLNAQKDNK
ncbi:MAG: carbon storage regulator CsrA [Oscillospiraceae bacterium]